MNKKFWESKKILITGGTGILGSELTAQLLGTTAELVLIVRDNVAKSRVFLEKMNKKVNIVSGDITDFSLVERTIGEYEIDTVFHLAAQTIVRIGNVSPLSTFNTNILGTCNVLEACRLHNKRVTSIIVASSDKAYGECTQMPYNESTPLLGRHPYDVSKSCADLISQSFWHTYKLPVVVTRCGNLFGPGDLNFNRIIPGTIRSVLLGEAPVIRSDGDYVRNYFYIKDAVDAYITLSENMPLSMGNAFNIGTAERYTVLEIVKNIIRVMKSDLKPIVLNEVSNEIREQYLDVSRIKDILGWKAKSKFDNAILETVDWYKKYVR